MMMMMMESLQRIVVNPMTAMKTMRKRKNVRLVVLLKMRLLIFFEVLNVMMTKTVEKKKLATRRTNFQTMTMMMIIGMMMRVMMSAETRLLVVWMTLMIVVRMRMMLMMRLMRMRMMMMMTMMTLMMMMHAYLPAVTIIPLVAWLLDFGLAPLPL